MRPCLALRLLRGFHKGGVALDSLVGDGEAIVVLDCSPFYAESGGQVGDIGTLETNGCVFRVVDTQKLSGGVIGHFGRIVKVTDLL